MVEIAMKEWDEARAKENSKQEVRHFDQTYKEHFVKKPIDRASLGKRVMKNINQRPIPDECRDSDFLADMGFKDR